MWNYPLIELPSEDVATLEDEMPILEKEIKILKETISNYMEVNFY